MKLLIVGAKGQLGSELKRTESSHQLLAVDMDELDITDASAVMDCIAAYAPDIVINAAAYTDVDRAESDIDLAFAVNRDGPKNLAVTCRQASIPLIHISTDYVFDGSKQGAYTEVDQAAPLGIYGESKLAGELAVKKYSSQYVILRTSWVFSANGRNFVNTMLRLGLEREEFGVVIDQQGCPTSAGELSRAIYAVLERQPDDSMWGIYHFCQPEPTTWFGFANAIFDEARKQGIELKTSTLNAILTSSYPTTAKRPANSVMDCLKFSQTFNFTIKPWSESLVDVIKELKGA